uniref:Uncharacterized protein n=1 Tax=Ailuropoda melanoleuca TaxID=9646 RepID=A0A7N5P198_AILME
MTTLDDKLLGEKLQYYYSSSEEEDSEEEEGSAESHSVRDATVPKEVALNSDGSAINTALPCSWALRRFRNRPPRLESRGSSLPEQGWVAYISPTASLGGGEHLIVCFT